MPLHTRLLGKDSVTLFPFIHSFLDINFEDAVSEPIAIELAKANFQIATKQIYAGTQISESFSNRNKKYNK